MLTDAQPTSIPARHTRRSLSAAGGVFMAVIAILVSLALPKSVSAEGSAAATSGSGAWPWPLLGEVVTPYRNGSDPYAAGQHRGLDIAAPAGSPVLAIVGGRVTFSGKLPDGGETVTVQSGDGSWLLSHLHLSNRAVARGDSVIAGDLLGNVGLTGKRSAAQPHLHLSVRRADTRAYVDPLSLLGAQRLPVPAPVAPTAVPAANAKPVASAKPEAVTVTPLEGKARGSRSVHAQSTGDVTPAVRNGAHGSAGERAREGHAADQASSRVAPPPLRTASPAVTHIAEPAVEPVATESTAVRKPRDNRRLLVVIAVVCLVALAMRRRARPGAIGPTGEADAAAEGEPAEVIAIAGRRRSA